MNSAAICISMPLNSPGTRGRVLCVDDEPNVLRALNWLLQKDFEVSTATSGQEGLRLLRESSFDVVLSDQRMPEMSGVDFLSQVKAIAPRTMRILLTGYADMQALVSSVNESDIFRYVSKPWDVSELPKLIARAAEIARSPAVLVADPAPLDDARLAASGARILLIDDDPEVHTQAELALGGVLPIVHASSLPDAVRELQKTQVSVILTDARIGALDSTRLIRLLKQRYPEVVTVMLAEESDVNLVSSLINQGRIFRFVAKPIKTAHLERILRSAVARHLQLMQELSWSPRHEAAARGETGAAEQAQDIATLSAPASSVDERAQLPGAWHGAGFRGAFRRLFGNR